METDVIEFLLSVLAQTPITVTGDQIEQLADLQRRAKQQLNDLRIDPEDVTELHAVDGTLLSV